MCASPLSSPLACPFHCHSHCLPLTLYPLYSLRIYSHSYYRTAPAQRLTRPLAKANPSNAIRFSTYRTLYACTAVWQVAPEQKGYDRVKHTAPRHKRCIRYCHSNRYLGQLIFKKRINLSDNFIVISRTYFYEKNSIIHIRIKLVTSSYLSIFIK